MSAKKAENFYRRDPGAALAGMVSMTLEERGVYNTVIDLLYLTWRPLEDNAAYIAGHCGCAVQKINPILRRLIEREKLIRFTEGGQSYISNPAFERERLAVKGDPNTRSGRGEVGEKSAGVGEKSGEVGEKSGEVGEKSGEVGENPPLLDIEVEQKQDVTPLDRQEKTRQEKKGAITSPPKGPSKSDVEAVWSITPRRSRERSNRHDVGLALSAAIGRGHSVTTVVEGLRGYFATDAGRDDGEYAKAVHRMIEGDRWKDFAPPPPEPWPDEKWARALKWVADGKGEWQASWGPMPGEPGCLVPEHLIAA